MKVPSVTSAFFEGIVVVMLFAVFFAAAQHCPPSGYDTYDLQPIWAGYVPTEVSVLQQAEVLAKYSKAAGGWWKTMILDEGWADVRLANFSYVWTLTPNAVPTPIVSNFPSAAGGEGLKPLAAQLKSKFGMELGVWHVKGIPKIAVELKMPILGTNYTADQIITSEKLSCSWHKDVYDVDPEHPGGQAYYDSVVDTWTSWGITYLKIDCIFGSDLRMTEIQAYSNAVLRAEKKYKVKITLSISPGFLANRSSLAPVIANTAVNLARVTDDVWDCWGPSVFPAPECLLSNIVSSVWTLEYFQPYLNTFNRFGSRFAPDPDMIPVSFLRLLYPHQSTLTGKMLNFVFGMWAMTKSPIILGGDLTQIDNATLELPQLTSLLGNADLKDLHCSGANPRVVYSHNITRTTKTTNRKSEPKVNISAGEIVWALDRTHKPGEATKFQVYVGYFPFDPWVDHNIDVNTTCRKILWAEIGLNTGFLKGQEKAHKKNVFGEAFSHRSRSEVTISTYDVLNRKIGPTFYPATTDGFTLTTNFNDAVIWLLSLNE